MRIPVHFGGAGHDRGPWLALLLLLLAVLAPTAGLLWFMNTAATAQRDLARRRLQDAWRGQLALVRDRLDLYWAGRAADLDRLEAAPPVLFERVVRTGLADAVISPAYPSNALPVPAAQAQDREAAHALERRGEYRAAAEAFGRIPGGVAAQARIRCLVRAGDRRAAVREIGRRFTRGPLARATDPQGRLIAADELLLAHQLGDPAAAARLRALLNDYTVPMPSAQRLFLMEALPGQAFPTLEAERLAARYLDARQTAATEPALRPAGLPDVWKLGSPAGRVIALYRTATLAAAVRGMAKSIALQPPGAAPGRFDESIPAGARMPGWQLTLALHDNQPFDDLARRQQASLWWVGFLVIAAMGASAVIAGQALRRQWRLARLKTDLVAAVSHELRTPVASVRALADTLLDEGRFEPQKTREYLELIARENQRLGRLVENFLTFSRMERNRQQFSFAETRPEAVARVAVEATRERWQEPQSRLEVKLAPDLPPLDADEDALVTVLVNLLDNAYKYTVEPRRVVLAAYGENGRVVFSVTDNGIGIHPRERKRIFRRFYQVDRRLARQAGGCGLGLSIVEFIVKAHGGTVAVESRPGAGSIFTVRLPVSQVTA